VNHLDKGKPAVKAISQMRMSTYQRFPVRILSGSKLGKELRGENFDCVSCLRLCSGRKARRHHPSSFVLLELIFPLFFIFLPELLGQLLKRLSFAKGIKILV
jgi:hypothetical protein